jgi:hypothetical protein
MIERSRGSPSALDKSFYNGFYKAASTALGPIEGSGVGVIPNKGGTRFLVFRLLFFLDKK